MAMNPPYMNPPGLPPGMPPAFSPYAGSLTPVAPQPAAPVVPVAQTPQGRDGNGVWGVIQKALPWLLAYMGESHNPGSGGRFIGGYLQGQQEQKRWNADYAAKEAERKRKAAQDADELAWEQRKHNDTLGNKAETAAQTAFNRILTAYNAASRFDPEGANRVYGPLLAKSAQAAGLPWMDTPLSVTPGVMGTGQKAAIDAGVSQGDALLEVGKMMQDNLGGTAGMPELSLGLSRALGRPYTLTYQQGENGPLLGPGSLFAKRQSDTEGQEWRNRLLGAEYDVKSDPAYIASMVKKPGVDNNRTFWNTEETRLGIPFVQPKARADIRYRNAAADFMSMQPGFRDRALDLQGRTVGMQEQLLPYRIPGMLGLEPAPGSTYTVDGETLQPFPAEGLTFTAPDPSPSKTNGVDTTRARKSGLSDKEYKDWAGMGGAYGPQAPELIQKYVEQGTVVQDDKGIRFNPMATPAQREAFRKEMAHWSNGRYQYAGPNTRIDLWNKGAKEPIAPAPETPKKSGIRAEIGKLYNTLTSPKGKSVPAKAPVPAQEVTKIRAFAKSGGTWADFQQSRAYRGYTKPQRDVLYKAYKQAGGQ